MVNWTAEHEFSYWFVWISTGVHKCGHILVSCDRKLECVNGFF